MAGIETLVMELSKTEKMETIHTGVPLIPQAELEDRGLWDNKDSTGCLNRAGLAVPGSWMNIFKC